MSRPTPTYDDETVQTIRTWVKGCETWLEARQIIAEKTGIHPDNITRMNRRHGFWAAKPGKKDVMPPWSEVRAAAKAREVPVTQVRGRPFKRLYLDLETSPNICLTWRVGYKINLDYDNILTERAVICACWKWEGDDTVYSLNWDAEQGDKALLAELIDVVNQADEVIAHNGARFDVPWVRTRCLFHKLPPLNPGLKIIDTLTWARRHFYFNSNRLDYIAKFLGLGGKLKTEFGLWKAIVLEKDAGALKRMVTYCKNDVVQLEKVWSRLSRMVPHKSHVGVIAGGEKWSCPHDGSTDVKVSKTRVTAGGTIQYQMLCNECGGYYTIGERAHQAYLEAKTR